MTIVKKKITPSRFFRLLIKFLLYLLPIGWLVALAVSLGEAYYYPGVLIKHASFDPLVIYFGYGILSLPALYGDAWKTRFIRSFRTLNYFAVFLFGLVYGVFYLLEQINYPNYVFSTFHLHPLELATPLFLSLYSLIVSSKDTLLIIIKNDRVLLKWVPFIVILSWVLFNNFADSGSYAVKKILFMIKNPRASYDEKMEVMIGKQFYNYVQFVRKVTPEHSKILIPPFPTWPWAQTGNIPYMTYFLYPRKLLNGKEFFSSYDLEKEGVDYVLVVWGELPPPPGSIGGWPKFDVMAEKVIYLDNGGIREKSGDYIYEEVRGKEVWGVIKLKR